MIKTKYIRFGSVFLIIPLLFFSSAAPTNDELTSDILKHTNKFRRSKGLTVLVMRDDLNAIARRHSEDMASSRTGFGHGGFKQREQKVKKIVKPYYGMAENVAFGARSGKDAFEMWKNSSEHRKNMLGNYKYIGIGAARSRRGVIYYTEIFVK